jgi:hypothetical protein
MSPRKPKVHFPVDPSAIRREIRAAAKKLHTMEEKASLKQSRAIKQELRILKQFYEKLGNIVEI